MKKLILAASVLTMSLSFSSCSKKTSDPAPSLTPLQILQSHTWKPSSAKMDGVEMLSSCDLDNTITFKSDFTSTEDEGATKCDPSDNQVETSVYALSSDNKTFTIDGITYTVTSITDATFVMTTTFGSSTIVATLVKK